MHTYLESWGITWLERSVSPVTWLLMPASPHMELGSSLPRFHKNSSSNNELVMAMKKGKQKWRSTCVCTRGSVNLTAHWTNRLDAYRKMNIFAWQKLGPYSFTEMGILFTYLRSVRKIYCPQILFYRDMKLFLFSVTDTSFPVRHVYPRPKKPTPQAPKIQENP